MSTWTPGRILGSRVMMSPDRGPAVVGVRRSIIVMPQWISELEDHLLRLVFLHEREHQQSGDHRLFALGLVTLLLMPWNLFLWWEVRRLRLAIEYDCDRRVIGQDVDPRDYAEALLIVGSRVSGPLLAAAAFAERKPAIEQRLRRMTRPLRRLRGPRALVAGGFGVLALALACSSPLPTSSDEDAQTGLTPAVDAVPTPQVDDVDPGTAGEANPATKLPPPAAGGGASYRPSFIPYDTPPVLQNSADVQQALTDKYPPDLQGAGVGGRAEIWIFVDQTGRVTNRQIKTSSGSPRLDEAAEEVIDAMQFRPAENRGKVTGVWVSQWLTFTPPGSPAPTRPSPEGQPPNPLIVIDGEIADPDTELSDIGALDIERVEIMKGEAARQLYGDRARAGVIQITTKTGGPDGPR